MSNSEVNDDFHNSPNTDLPCDEAINHKNVDVNLLIKSGDDTTGTENNNKENNQDNNQDNNHENKFIIETNIINSGEDNKYCGLQDNLSSSPIFELPDPSIDFRKMLVDDQNYHSSSQETKPTSNINNHNLNSNNNSNNIIYYNNTLNELNINSNNDNNPNSSSQSNPHSLSKEYNNVTKKISNIIKHLKKNNNAKKNNNKKKITSEQITNNIVKKTTKKHHTCDKAYKGIRSNAFSKLVKDPIKKIEEKLVKDKKRDIKDLDKIKDIFVKFTSYFNKKVSKSIDFVYLYISFRRIMIEYFMFNGHSDSLNDGNIELIFSEDSLKILDKTYKAIMMEYKNENYVENYLKDYRGKILRSNKTKLESKNYLNKYEKFSRAMLRNFDYYLISSKVDSYFYDALDNELDQVVKMYK